MDVGQRVAFVIAKSNGRTVNNVTRMGTVKVLTQRGVVIAFRGKTYSRTFDAICEVKT